MNRGGGRNKPSKHSRGGGAARGGKIERKTEKKHDNTGNVNILEFPPLPTFSGYEEKLLPGMGGFVDVSRKGGGRTLELAENITDDFDFGGANAEFNKASVMQEVQHQEEKGQISYILDNEGRSKGVVIHDNVISGHSEDFQGNHHTQHYYNGGRGGRRGRGRGGADNTRAPTADNTIVYDARQNTKSQTEGIQATGGVRTAGSDTTNTVLLKRLAIAELQVKLLCGIGADELSDTQIQGLEGILLRGLNRLKLARARQRKPPAVLLSPQL